MKVFGETAEKIARTAQKGAKIYVEGQLSLNTWEGQGGEKHTGINLACWKAEKIGTSANGRASKVSIPI